MSIMSLIQKLKQSLNVKWYHSTMKPCTYTDEGNYNRKLHLFWAGIASTFRVGFYHLK